MTSTQKILAGVAAVGAIMLVVYATRKDDPPKGTTTTPTTTDSVTSTTSSGPTANPGTAPPPSQTAPSGSPGTITSGAPVDVETLAKEAKYVDAAREALRNGEPKKAVAELENYDRVPNRGALKQEADLLKIEAYSKTGRKTDALIIAMNMRDDPSYAPYRGRVEALVEDAGLVMAPPIPPPPR